MILPRRLISIWRRKRLPFGKPSALAQTYAQGKPGRKFRQAGRRSTSFGAGQEQRIVVTQR
jgi:hypothetical protein